MRIVRFFADKEEGILFGRLEENEIYKITGNLYEQGEFIQMAGEKYERNEVRILEPVHLH